MTPCGGRQFRMLEIEGAKRPGDTEPFESLPLAVKPST
jgi:hypothetical protein